MISCIVSLYLQNLHVLVFDGVLSYGLVHCKINNNNSPARQGWRGIDGLFVENRHLEMLLL